MRMTGSTFIATPIERVRDYWNRRPCNIRHSTQPVGAREYLKIAELFSADEALGMAGRERVIAAEKMVWLRLESVAAARFVD
jgi:hypothetical protein